MSDDDCEEDSCCSIPLLTSLSTSRLEEGFSVVVVVVDDVETFVLMSFCKETSIVVCSSHLLLPSRLSLLLLFVSFAAATAWFPPFR